MVVLVSVLLGLLLDGSVELVIDEEKLRREKVIGSDCGVLSPMLVGGMRSRSFPVPVVLGVRFGLGIVVFRWLV